MKLKKRTARKSLRTMVMMWLLMFSIVPLAFITGYSLVKYEQAINQELVQRLIANHRELRVIFSEFENELSARNKIHANEKMMSYYLSSNAIAQARDLATRWMQAHFNTQTSIFSRDKRLQVSLFRDVNGNVKRNQGLEGSVVLDDSFVRAASEKGQVMVAEFTKDKNLDLAVFSPIRASNNSVVGYLDEVLRIDRSFLDNIKNRLNLEVALIAKDGSRVVSSHDDLESYRQNFFPDLYGKLGNSLHELNIRGEPHGIMIQEMEWGKTKVLVLIAASKMASAQILKTVNFAFFTVVGAVVLLLVVLSFFISRSLLRPVNELVQAVQAADMDADKPIEVQSDSDTELGILSDSFNEMFERVHGAQKELKENIKMLESANQEIRDTQAKLVHSAKMASLGQLVAGVAHELNNPIGFIYSNMTHLRDYADRLIQLVRTAEKSPEKMAAEKERLEFDYIVGDMPKLIRSCEDGARRTKDIVAGLRNFSRLDEAKLKEADIHEGIESTLALLSSEMKEKIQLHKDFGQIRKIMCYPSQLNQVFMNIFSNATQAMPDGGDLYIQTKDIGGDRIQISIRDTGIGMSEEIAQKIFDPFFTTKEISQGTGLGMSIAYGIIQKHGGEIRVQSQRGKGTEFHILLPYVAAHS